MKDLEFMKFPPSHKLRTAAHELRNNLQMIVLSRNNVQDAYTSTG